MPTQVVYVQAPTQPSAGQEIYSGFAGLGRLSAIISAIIATIVGLILIGWGIWLIGQTSNSVGGWILIGLGIFAILISWGWVYLTERSKFLASLGGVDTTLQFI